MTPSIPLSLRALLAGSVDYAGLFPPAGLPLDRAVENHAAHARGSDAWMLGCFVLPAVQLPEIGPLLTGRFEAARPLRLSALGPRAAGSADGFLEGLRASLCGMTRFRQTHGRTATVDQYEGSLPPVPAPAGSSLRALLRDAAGLIETLSPEPLRTFWEVPFSGDLPATLRNVAAHNAALPSTGRPSTFGVKLRTGGTDAAAFPTSGQLAEALLVARDAGLALKFTAGLHHPLRCFDAGLGTRMHGFLNVFAAGVLAREHSLDVAEVQAILEDEAAENFRFEPDGFFWCHRRVSAQALETHRKFIASFGSCSFDEPRDDLRRLGLLA